LISQGKRSQDGCDNGDELMKWYASKDKQLQVCSWATVAPRAL